MNITDLFNLQVGKIIDLVDIESQKLDVRGLQNATAKIIKKNNKYHICEIRVNGLSSVYRQIILWFYGGDYAITISINKASREVKQMMFRSVNKITSIDSANVDFSDMTVDRFISECQLGNDKMKDDNY